MAAGRPQITDFGRILFRQFPRRYIPTPLTPPSACLYATTERGNGTTEWRGGSNDNVAIKKADCSWHADQSDIY